MQIYKFINLDSDTILLQKITINYDNYTIIDKENGDKLLQKINYIIITDINVIKEYDFTKSEILECLINNIKIKKIKYKQILYYN